jgi:hypothetical protein
MDEVILSLLITLFMITFIFTGFSILYSSRQDKADQLMYRNKKDFTYGTFMPLFFSWMITLIIYLGLLRLFMN